MGSVQFVERGYGFPSGAEGVDAALFDLQAKYADVVGLYDALAYLDHLPGRNTTAHPASAAGHSAER
ncbi:hypothetical protein ACWDKQ_34205 [Saccharopolyspora sp. NPDC000995]